MTLHFSIRKIYQDVADRRQMFRLFDRHAQRPNRWQGDDGALFAGEWFEIGQPEYDYMFEILPPLWMRGEMFALREFLTESVTSVFYMLRIDGKVRTSTPIAISPWLGRRSRCARPSSTARPGR